MTLAIASTINVITKRISPSATSEDRYKSPTASVNSFANVAEIVVPGCRIEVLMRCALPMTKVTAIVSPSARPRPSMTPPTTPIRVYGRTTCQTTSVLVEPRAYALSLRIAGTVSNTSRMIDETNGSTMIARMNPAVSTPMPSGGPAKSAPIPGSRPNVSMIAGSMYDWTNGANTKSPQIP